MPQNSTSTLLCMLTIELFFFFLHTHTQTRIVSLHDSVSKVIIAYILPCYSPHPPAWIFSPLHRAKTQNFQRYITPSTTVVYRNVNPCRCTNLNNIVYIIVYKGSYDNYNESYVVQISISTGVYNYCSLQSCTPFEILCFGPVLLENQLPQKPTLTF